MAPVGGWNRCWLVGMVVFLVATLACRCSAARPGRGGVVLSTSGSVVLEDGTTVEEYEVGEQTHARDEPLCVATRDALSFDAVGRGVQQWQCSISCS